MRDEDTTNLASCVSANPSLLSAAKIKVAVAGSYGFMDIGDEAMLTEDLHYLHQEIGIPRENIFLFGAMPEYVSNYHRHPSANCVSSEILVSSAQTAKQGLPPKIRFRERAKDKWRTLRGKPSRLPKAPQPSISDEVLAKCNFGLITGGGTINSRDGARWSLERIHLLVTEFKRFGLPVFMSGQTIGPLGLHAEDDRIAREIVEMVDVLSVRDSDYSRRYLNLIGAKPKELIETFDDAYCLPYHDAELSDDLLRLLESNQTAAFNVTDYTADTVEKRIFMAELAEQMLERKMVEQLVFLSHTPRDLQHLYMIRDMVRNHLKPRITVPDTRLWRDASLKRLISRCAVAVGGRYHFIVFAGSCDTPFVGLTGNHYSYVKQDGFARPLGLSNFIATEKETWQQDFVLGRIGEALQSHLNLGDRFLRPSVSMKRLGDWLRNDLKILPHAPKSVAIESAAT